MSDRAILSVQVSGFLAALVIILFLRGRVQLLFALAFAVHLVGDLLRLYKDHIWRPDLD